MVHTTVARAVCLGVHFLWESLRRPSVAVAVVRCGVGGGDNGGVSDGVTVPRCLLHLLTYYKTARLHAVQFLEGSLIVFML